MPSTDASNVMVALNVPVTCTATKPGDGRPDTLAASFCAATVTLLVLRSVAAISCNPKPEGFC